MKTQMDTQKNSEIAVKKKKKKKCFSIQVPVTYMSAIELSC